MSLTWITYQILRWIIKQMAREQSETEAVWFHQKWGICSDCFLTAPADEATSKDNTSDCPQMWQDSSGVLFRKDERAHVAITSCFHHSSSSAHYSDTRRATYSFLQVLWIPPSSTQPWSKAKRRHRHADRPSQARFSKDEYPPSTWLKWCK